MYRRLYRMSWVRRTVLGLSAVCLFGVTYLFVLPASALNKDSGDYACGRKQHQHGSLCYESVLSCEESHAHDKSCFSDLLVCEFDEHTHGDTCVK